MHFGVLTTVIIAPIQLGGAARLCPGVRLADQQLSAAALLHTQCAQPTPLLADTPDAPTYLTTEYRGILL